MVTLAGFGHSFAAQTQQRSVRGVLIVGVVLNLGMLGFFKYGKFFFGSAFPDIPLPIGISFYIFQAMSYLIDVCRREVEVQKNVLTFGTYVTLFPQLIAGPIVRYRDVAEMLESRRENLPQFSRGVQRFVVGLSKKVLLANTFGAAWNALQVTTGTAAAWLGRTKFQLAPCHSPVSIHTTRMFKNHRGLVTRLPPRGMYT